MHKILKSFLKRLTNLTASNRSLLLLKLSEEQDMDLHALDFIEGKSSFFVIDQLLSGKKEIVISPAMDSRNQSINNLSKKLKKINRRDDFIFQERGSKDLYVGWPFVRGKFSEGTMVRCPLLFFPLTLEIKGNNWVLKVREDVPVSFNKSFLLAYSHYNEVSLSDEFLETSFEDFDKDPQVFRTELYSLLKESPLKLNFNQDLFVNKLQSFEQFKRSDYQEQTGNGELKLYQEAVLGIFPQSGSYLVPDYEYLLSNITNPDLEEFFFHRTHTHQSDKIAAVKEEHTITPYSIDASQEKAILDVKKGKSLVVQGPPGTGKSQLICNLIADFISRGKNVLVVCQKRAALDVVYDRLKSKEISEFVGLVHDFRNDRKQIFEQINSQIEKLDEYKYRNNSLDAIYLERQFVQVCRRIEQLTEELEEFRRALYDEQECGISVKELYLISDPSAKTFDLKQEYRFFKSEEINNFTKALKALLPYSSRFEQPSFIWNDRVSFNGFTIQDKQHLLDLLDHIPFYQTELSNQVQEILGATLEMEDLEWLYDRQEQVGQLLHLLEDERTYSKFQHFINKSTDKDWLIIREKQISECFKGSGIETSIPSDQLGIIQKALENARQARASLFKWVRWRLFSKDKYLLKRVFVANKLKWNKKGFEELSQRVDNRMNLEHNITELRQCNWLTNIPEEKDFNAFSEWFHYQQTALGAKEIIKELRFIKDCLNIPSLTFVELKGKLLSLVKIVSKIPNEKRKWLQYLTPRQVSRILSAFDYSIDLSKSLEKDFESLVEYDTIRVKLSTFERNTFEKIIRQYSGESVDTVVEIFRNSVSLEWIAAIEMKYPVLRSVSSLKMEQMESELQDCVEEKEKLSSEILLLKVRERTYSSLEYNRLENLVTYRDLKHQVTKKKKIWPLRKLIQAHSSEIFNLVPCWLASPESVSSLFSMETVFDLVVFDEASQCFAENGIPAVYRGRQVVITGDSKQLSPSDLYTIRWDDEDEDIPELEIDSLLDLSKNYLQEVKLTGHYRSKSLDLIEFSNIHFYNHTLRMLPDFTEINKFEPAIRYQKVSGTWENNTNLKEAEEVARLVKELHSSQPEKSIGVVTFNYKQQVLIQDLLEMHLNTRELDWLFVKNIENVQGDEKDIIIFSVGYAPTEKGKFAMNFGSLNAAKGENRLNVAITRAREMIYIITSILPHQLDVSASKHEGPKLLKKYLEYAHDVSENKFKTQLGVSSGKRMDWYLKRHLLEAGLPFSINDELPFSDLTVLNKNKYLGLIQTDDDLYYQSITAKDAHAFIPLALRRKNWRYKKIYSRMYWENKESVKESLIKNFHNAQD